MSLTHEIIRNENKKMLKKIISKEKKLYKLEGKKDFIWHELNYSSYRRGWSEEECEEASKTIKELQKQIDYIKNRMSIKSDLKNTMSLARVTSLQSFIIRNNPITNKILSDSHLLNHIASFNTGL